MKQWKMRLWSCVLALVLLVSLTPIAQAEDGEDSTLKQFAEGECFAAVDYTGAFSAQCALWKDGEIVLTEHFGNYSKTENRALTDDILYGVGSISKTYTAAAMMKLVDQGKVNLDAPVTRYLPDFKMADERYKDITVRMLLNHSSGLMGGTVVNSFLFADRDYDATDDLLNHLATQHLQADPGAYSVYSNDSFSLAQLVIERVSGLDFNAYLEKYITGPLGLENTFTPADEFDTSRLAKTYLESNNTTALPQETLAIAGCGGIYATASDLATFGGALTSAGLLSEKSLKAMAANEYARGMWPEDSEDDALAYGLGWDNVHMYPFNQNGIQALVKGGDTMVYHAALVILPEYDMACAVVSSGGVSTYNQAAAANILIAVLAEEGVELPDTPANRNYHSMCGEDVEQLSAALTLDDVASAQMPAELMDYSGYYGTSAMIGTVTVSADGVLTLDLGDTKQQFAYREDGSFRDASNTVLLKFVEEENGQVYLFQKGYTRVPGWADFAAANYVLERLPDYEAPAEALAAWQAREGKIYLQTNERYSSALYAFSGVFGAVSLQGMPEGYLLTNQITDVNTAVPVVQIPGTGSRDSGYINVVNVDGVEYLEINGGMYRDASAVDEISAANASYCTVDPDNARWYRVGDAAGKTMTVQVPTDGSFAVYDANMQIVASSWVFGDTNVTLPADGWVVFAAGSTQRFDITMAAA